MYASFDDISTVAFGKLQNFRQLRKIILSHNNLCTFAQLSSLRKFSSSITDIEVSENPVCSMKLFRKYVAHRLRNIIVVNGKRVSDQERFMANKLFSKATHAAGQAAKERRSGRNEILSRNYAEKIISNALLSDEKGKPFESRLEGRRQQNYPRNSRWTARHGEVWA